MTPDRVALRGAPRRARARARPAVEALEARELMAVQIVGMTLVSDRAGSITLTLVQQVSPVGPRGPEQVAVDTGGGTAVPGVDYAPIHQVITFLPRDRSKIVTVPIFQDDQNPDGRTFALTLDHAAIPPGPAPAGDLAARPRGQVAVITIVHQPTAQPPPKVKETRLLTSGNLVTGFVVTFDKDMALGPVQDVANYAILQQGRNSAAVPLSSAIYNSSRRSVTLVPAQPAGVGRYVVENPGPGARSALADTQGNALDGIGDGLPNGILYAEFSPRGSTLGPIYRKQFIANQRLHASKQSHRGQTLGSVLGLALPYLL